MSALRMPVESKFDLCVSKTESCNENARLALVCKLCEVRQRGSDARVSGLENTEALVALAGGRSGGSLIPSTVLICPALPLHYRAHLHNAGPAIAPIHPPPSARQV